MTQYENLLSYDFYARRQLVVRHSDLEMSSDAGTLLARQAPSTSADLTRTIRVD